MRNRSKILVLAIASLLSACDLGPSTPLSDALAALRRGDREALLRAREDAQAALRTAAPTMGCISFDPEGERKLAEVAVINELDNTNLFDLPEHERLVYAVNAIIATAKDYSASEYASEYTDPENCSLSMEEERAAILASVAESQQKGIAVRRALDRWFAAQILIQGRNYKTNMKQAADHLTSIGLPATWPLPTGPQVTTIDGPTGKVIVIDDR